MAAGWGILFISAAFLAQATIRRPIPDLALWITAGAMIAVRFVDVNRLGGTTAEGEAATPRHARRFAVLVAVSAAVLWIAAQGIALLLRG